MIWFILSYFFPDENPACRLTKRRIWPKIIKAVLDITGQEDDNKTHLYINSLVNQILAFLNRDEITEEMFPVIVSVIVDYLENSAVDTGNIQSLREGDMSVSYISKSPFFGKLDSFKLIRGIH